MLFTCRIGGPDLCSGAFAAPAANHVRTAITFGVGVPHVAIHFDNDTMRIQQNICDWCIVALELLVVSRKRSANFRFAEYTLRA